MAAELVSKILFCMPKRTKRILLVTDITQTPFSRHPTNGTSFLRRSTIRTRHLGTAQVERHIWTPQRNERLALPSITPFILTTEAQYQNYTAQHGTKTLNANLTTSTLGRSQKNLLFFCF
jgi:hypothetical protein